MINAQTYDTKELLAIKRYLEERVARNEDSVARYSKQLAQLEEKPLDKVVEVTLLGKGKTLNTTKRDLIRFIGFADNEIGVYQNCLEDVDRAIELLKENNLKDMAI